MNVILVNPRYEHTLVQPIKITMVMLTPVAMVPACVCAWHWALDGRHGALRCACDHLLLIVSDRITFSPPSSSLNTKNIKFLFAFRKLCMCHTTNTLHTPYIFTFFWMYYDRLLIPKLIRGGKWGLLYKYILFWKLKKPWKSFISHDLLNNFQTEADGYFVISEYHF